MFAVDVFNYNRKIVQMDIIQKDIYQNERNGCKKGLQVCISFDIWLQVTERWKTSRH